jgi:hypothetical protein
MSEDSSDKLLSEIIRGIGTYFSDLEVYDRVVRCLVDDEFGVLRHFLLVPGVLDVLPPTGHPQGQPVLMLRVKYQDQSCMLIAATAAHMRVMIDLMRECEEDCGCSVIPNGRSVYLDLQDLNLPALPMIIADEIIDNDTETKMKTKIVSVPVRAEIILPERVETFTGLVWVSAKQKLVAVRVVVQQEGDKRQAFAVIGPTDASRVSEVNPLGLNVDTKVQSNYHPTVLMLASIGRLGEVKVLLEAGANINAMNDNGDTALNYAIFRDDSQIFNELLMNKNINISLKNTDRGRVPLHIACY